MSLLADTPALPLHTAGKYVAAAYIVVFAVVLIYVAIMAIRLSHIERDLGELLELSAPASGGEQGAREAQLEEPPHGSQSSARESAPA